MPNRTSKTREQRILASWRTRACAAGLCAGTQLFLAGCASGMPLALNGAWLAALAALPFGAWLAACSRRALLQPVHSDALTRMGYGFVFAALLGCAAFALASITGFAAQTLAQRTRTLWIETAVLLAVLLSALFSGTGVSRLCFAARYALCALVLGLAALPLSMRAAGGLFPILGAGADRLGLAALSMLFGAAPALMLMLPPPELEAIPREDWRVPSVRFFLLRLLAGALAGCLLLVITCAMTTYESIAQSGEWGARLRLAAGNPPHEGIVKTLLTLAKLMAMLLLAVNMLCAARQALIAAAPGLAGYKNLLLCALLLAAALLVQAVFGDAPLLWGAPVIALLAVPAAIVPGRRRRE